jgi:hypothetical protein
VIRESHQENVKAIRTMLMNMIREWHQDPSNQTVLLYEGVNLGHPLEHLLHDNLLALFNEGGLLADEIKTDDSVQ